MIAQYIRKDLQQFKPYHAPLIDYAIKVDANENPFNHSNLLEGILTDKAANSGLLNRYPDTDSNEIRELLGDKYLLSKENIVMGVGSDQLIDCIMRVFLDPGDKVLAPYPSFSMYYLTTKLNHGVSVLYELDDNFDYQIDTIKQRIEVEQPKMLIICRPNNPTGNSITNSQILEILNFTRIPVIVDEAYAEFLEESIVQEINNYDNLIVLRTFSKAYGLAGLRLGYAIAQSSAIEVINIAKPPYNISALNQAIGLQVLENENFYKEQIQVLLQERERVIEKLKDCSVVERIYPSKANFLLIRFSDVKIISQFKNSGFLVRSYEKDRRLEGCIRLTIGTPVENDQIIQLIREYNA